MNAAHNAMVRSLQSALQIFGRRAGTCFAVQLPDGMRLFSADGTPVFTIVFHNDASLVACAVRGHMALLEAYFDGEVDLDGDLGAALAAGMNAGFDLQSAAVNHAENTLLEWRSSNRDVQQAKANARAHYGLGEPFYALWLDAPLKMYTCAYWRDGTDTLEQAQRDKIDHVIRKARLARGECFIDIGCGFGGFMFRAQETTGATGVGLNTTTEQVAWLASQIEERGLTQALSVQEADFREVDAQYDKVISIGVLEHAGRDQLPEVIQAHASFLKPTGLGVLHFIGHVARRETEPFIRKHVFPGGWIPALEEVLVEMERCGLEVLDIENLRRHYAPTLDEWARRFAANWPRIQALDPKRFDERFRRIWMCYLVGCAEMFRSTSGRTHLFQIVFSKGNVGATTYPMTRDHLYEPRAC